ncbi:MAG TPA: SDR family oxidoreductase [Vicinamibacteria bacterium]|nr:SDR family oxidoreductase [Vicinamibacteria bacterium]
MAGPTSAKPAVALVTGANRGLGLETCRQLVRRGCRVVMAGRDRDRLLDAMRSLDAGDDRLMAVTMDVREPAAIADAHDRAVRRFGQVDVLVNNAAVLLHENSEPLSIPAEGFHTTFETNVFGAIEVCRAFVPSMGERGYGRVVNVSSGAGQLSRMSTYAPAYSVSKAALNAFTRTLAAAYRGKGVLVNAVDPGWVRTDMGGAHAPRSVEQGADTIVWLATLPDGGPTGGFFRDRGPIEW